MKGLILKVVGAIALGVLLLSSPAILATPTYACEFVEKDCNKCGKKECKGCETEKQSEAKAEKTKSCSGTENGKSCCQSIKKAEKKETKEEAKK